MTQEATQVDDKGMIDLIPNTVPEMSQWVTSLLDMVTFLGRRFQPDVEPVGTVTSMLTGVLPIIRRIVPAEVIGFLSIHEDSPEFTLIEASPETYYGDLEKEVELQIDSDTFAWAIQQNRAVIVPSKHIGQSVILHVLATRSMVTGMFIAVLDEQNPLIPEIAQKGLSVVLLQCASAMEAATLYRSLNKSNVNLGKIVQERTKELLQSRTEAKIAKRTKSTFLANMSHEFRTPLNSIIGMTRLALDTLLTDEQVEYLNTALFSAESLLGLLDDILEFSQLGNNQVTYEPSPFDLRSCVESINEIIAVEAENKGLDLQMRFDPKAPRWLVGDASRIRQLLLQIARNAIKFTGNGQVFVDVSCVYQNENSSEIIFSVSDTGIGIPLANFATVFEEFTQSDSSDTRRFGGMGLGLAICRKLVERMGGTIGFSSEEGVGSTFWFRLNLMKSKPDSKVHDVALQKQTLKLLLYDKSVLVHAIISEMIDSDGSQVDRVYREDDFFVKIGEAEDMGCPYDVVLANIDLTRDSRDFFRVFKSITKSPLVALTKQSERVQARNVTYDAFVARPILRELFIVCINKVLNHNVPQYSSHQTRYVQPSYQITALLVEDDMANQMVASRILEKIGCRVEIANNGREAVEKTAVNHYDIIFMDCQMPEMDGYEATRIIRERDGDNAKIVALTARALTGDREKCLDAGMDDYLCKPVLPEDVERAIAKLVRNSDIHLVTQKQQTESAPDAVSHLDDQIFEKIYEMRHDDPGFVRDLFRIFFKSTSERLDLIRKSFKTKDLKQLQYAAHSLKGACGTCGAFQMASLCDVLEHIKSMADERISGLIKDVEDEYETVSIQIKARLSEGGISL